MDQKIKDQILMEKSMVYIASRKYKRAKNKDEFPYVSVAELKKKIKGASETHPGSSRAWLSSSSAG